MLTVNPSTDKTKLEIALLIAQIYMLYGYNNSRGGWEWRVEMKGLGTNSLTNFPFLLFSNGALYVAFAVENCSGHGFMVGGRTINMVRAINVAAELRIEIETSIYPQTSVFNGWNSNK